MPPSPPPLWREENKHDIQWLGFLIYLRGASVYDPHFCRIWTVDLKLIRALICGENSWLSNFWLDTDGRSMHTYCPNQLCALYAKGNKLRIQNTRTLFQKKDTANQMFQKTHVKILLMLSEYFSEQLKIHTKLTKLLGILGTQLRNCGSFQQRISG